MDANVLKDWIRTYGKGCDYMDPMTNNIYHVNAYFHDKRLGLPVEGMLVSYADGSKGIIPEDYLIKEFAEFMEEKTV